MEDIDNNNSEASMMDEEEEPEVKVKKKKPGIVYLSTIPDGMNPQLVREFLGQYGEIGKSFLQPLESMTDL